MKWAQVFPRPQLIFPPKTWFFGISLNFQRQKSQKSISPTFRIKISPNKFHLIVLIKIDLSDSTKGTFQFVRNFQLRFNLIFNQEIVQYSRAFALQAQTPWNQPYAPFLLESFPKRPRTASRFGGTHKYKQNKTNLR